MATTSSLFADQSVLQRPRTAQMTAEPMGTRSGAQQPTGTQPTQNKAVLQRRTASATAAPAPAQTFAQMSASGVARPAPPQASVATPYAGSAQSNEARSLLLEQVRQAMANPTRYDTDAYQQIRSAAANNIDADTQRAQAGSDEFMARRGLYDSTFAARDFQDIESNRARALASMEGDLLRDAAATQMNDRLGVASMTSNLAGLAGEQDLAQAQFNESGRQFDLQQQLAELLGMGQLGIQGQQLQLDRELGTGELQLGRDSLTQQGEQATLERQLRERLGLGELDLGNRQLDQSGEQFQQNLAEEGRQFDRSAGQTDLARQLQERLGLGELTGQVDGQNTVARDQMIADQDLARQNLLAQLLSMLGLNGITDLLGGSGGGGQTPPPSGPPSGGSAPPPSGGSTPPPTGSNGGPSGDGVRPKVPRSQQAALQLDPSILSMLLGGV